MASIRLVILASCLSWTDVSAVFAQNDANAEVTPGAIEDTTLDSSGAAAVDAANSVSTESVVQPSDSQQPSPTQVAPSEVSPALPPESSEQTTKTEAAIVEGAAVEPVVTPEVKAEPAVPAAPIADSVEPVMPETSEAPATKTVGTYGGRIFGRYKIQLASNKLTFNEGQKCYEKLYGKPQSHGSLSGDWFPLDYWINPGVTMRMGMYSVRGKTAKGDLSQSGTIDCDALTAVEDSKTTLLFIPIQLGAKVQVTPFRRKWVVLDLWMSGEYGWWQETRDADTTASIAPVSFVAAEQVYTNTGRKNAVSTGASAHILLNTLDERTVRSMIDTMGLGYVYLTGFVETVKSGSKTGLSFGRNVLGVGFTFETVK